MRNFSCIRKTVLFVCLFFFAFSNDNAVLCFGVSFLFSLPPLLGSIIALHYLPRPGYVKTLHHWLLRCLLSVHLQWVSNTNSVSRGGWRDQLQSLPWKYALQFDCQRKHVLLLHHLSEVNRETPTHDSRGSCLQNAFEGRNGSKWLKHWGSSFPGFSPKCCYFPT